MYYQYRGQFQQDPSELQVMNKLIASLGFEPPQAVVPNTPKEEKGPKEDLKKDSKEVENTKESDDSQDSEDSMGSNEPEYHKDPEDYDSWDFQKAA